MGTITSLTRMWLTKTTQPFLFRNEYDQELPYTKLEKLGLYIHIPFCTSICSFCPYCKVQYEEELCSEYVKYLIEEIHMVGKQAINIGRNIENDTGKKKVTSLYFGGGTPVLALPYLSEILDAVNQYYEVTEGIGIELHPDNVTVEVLQKLKELGITKISIGIQSFQKKFLSVLGRSIRHDETMFQALKTVPFETVSMDFIFALPEQTIEDLKQDIEMAFANGANHIAIYPFISFTFTKEQIPQMKNREKRKLLDDITKYCYEKGYHRESIWTFSKEKQANYSSMTRENFLGFGCSATTLLEKQFKVNTFSIEAYEERIRNKKLPTALTIRFTRRQRMVYYLFWTAYSTRVNKKGFEDTFGCTLKSKYGLELWMAKKLGYIIEDSNGYEMTLKGAYYYHYYENYYTLSYIDSMWSIMRKEAFPDRIQF